MDKLRRRATDRLECQKKEKVLCPRHLGCDESNGGIGKSTQQSPYAGKIQSSPLQCNPIQSPDSFQPLSRSVGPFALCPGAAACASALLLSLFTSLPFGDTVCACLATVLDPRDDIASFTILTKLSLRSDSLHSKRWHKHFGPKDEHQNAGMLCSRGATERTNLHFVLTGPCFFHAQAL